MNKERAEEIERLVIYSLINMLPPKGIDAERAFEVGQVIGRMQERLVNELAKEIEEDKDV